MIDDRIAQTKHHQHCEVRKKVNRGDMAGAYQADVGYLRLIADLRRKLNTPIRVGF